MLLKGLSELLVWRYGATIYEGRRGARIIETRRKVETKDVFGEFSKDGDCSKSFPIHLSVQQQRDCDL